MTFSSDVIGEVKVTVSDDLDVRDASGAKPSAVVNVSAFLRSSIRIPIVDKRPRRIELPG